MSKKEWAEKMLAELPENAHKAVKEMAEHLKKQDTDSAFDTLTVFCANNSPVRWEIIAMKEIAVSLAGYTSKNRG